MSLMVISILDKIVWFLLATVIATQALQIAGIVDTPSSSVDFNFNEPVPIPVNPIHENINQINKDIAEENDRSPIIDAIFNIPIKTLTVMNNLVQKSRPIFRRLGEFAFRSFQSSWRGNQEAEKAPAQKRSYPIYMTPLAPKKTQPTQYYY